MLSNKRVSRDIFELGWNREEFESVARHLADEVRFNYRGKQVTTDLEGLKNLVSSWRSSFPDLEFEILGLVGDGDLIAANLVLRGTQKGAWQDIPATGQPFEVEEMMFIRFEDGKVVELWEVFDEHEFRRQLQS